MLLFVGCKSEEKKAEKAAVDPFLQSAVSGDADAQFELYKLYKNGESVEKNPEEAAKWCVMAAEQGHPGALGWAYMLYDEGNGVPRDKAKALEWLLKADAVKESSILRRWIAERYDGGIGTDQDLKEAISWYEKAFELHDSQSAYRIGELYHDSAGEVYDREKAYEWFKIAVGMGLNAGAFHIGKAHLEGVSAPKDPELAYAWVLLARGSYPGESERGHGTTKALLEGILNEEQKAASNKKAEELLDECRESMRLKKVAASKRVSE